LSATPERFELGRNYPNPFNLSSSNSVSKTTIDFCLPGPERVTLFIYNILGQRIATLTETQLSTGRHRVTWDGRSDDGLPAASGTYLYRLEAGDFRMTRKLLLVR
ncbi:MAG: FlgD immunoglobulin-like domain containing protein, partial [bacterium]